MKGRNDRASIVKKLQAFPKWRTGSLAEYFCEFDTKVKVLTEEVIMFHERLREVKTMKDAALKVLEIDATRGSYLLFQEQELQTAQGISLKVRAELSLQ